MSVKESVAGQVDKARGFVERLRQRYLKAYASAVEEGSSRLSDLTRLSDKLAPSLRDAVNERIEDLQKRLDELNRSLADKAVPRDRKAKVDRMALSEKARQAVQERPLKVVAGQASDVNATPGESAAPTGAPKARKPAATGKAKTAPKSAPKAASKAKAASKPAAAKSAGKTSPASPRRKKAPAPDAV